MTDDQRAALRARVIREGERMIAVISGMVDSVPGHFTEHEVLYLFGLYANDRLMTGIMERSPIKRDRAADFYNNYV